MNKYKINVKMIGHLIKSVVMGQVENFSVSLPTSTNQQKLNDFSKIHAYNL